jgi:hypothetical protein
MEGEAVISYGLARNYREQLQTEIDNNANGLPLSRSGAVGAAKKIAILRRRNATLLGWRRDADAKKIDALETAMERICGIITEAVEKVGESVAAVAESVTIVADSVAAVHEDLRSLMRGEVVLDETTSLEEQSAACELALTVLKIRKKKIAEKKKEQKAQAKADAPPKRPRAKAATPRAKRCKTAPTEVPAEAPAAEAPAEAAAPEAVESVPVKMYEMSSGRRLWEVQFEADAENDVDLSPLTQLANEDSRRKFLNQLRQTTTGAVKDDVKLALYAVDGRRQVLMSQLPPHDRIKYIESIRLETK